MRNPLLPLLIIATLPLAGQSAAVPQSAAAATAPVAAPPAAGTLAPAFDTLDQDGVRHSLKAYAGQPVLLAFYPSDFTGGWTKELSQLRDDYTKFRARGIVILAVSLNDAESHRKFREKYSFPFSLLVDPDQRMTRAYGVLMRMDRGGQPFEYAGRSMFLIGADGKLAYADPDFKLSDAGWKGLFAAAEKLPKASRRPKKK